MRIAMLHPRPQRRGAELFAHQLTDRLRARGHAVTEMYLYSEPPETRLPSDSDRRILAHRPGWLESTVGWDPALARHLHGALEATNPEVVQVSGGNAVKYAALAGRRLAQRPLLVYRNIGQPDLWVRGWRRRWLYHRIVFPRVTAVATVAAAFLPRVRELCRSAVVARHIPNGIDVEALSPTLDRAKVRRQLDTPESAPVILFAGSLSPEKRVDRLLRAFRQLRSRTPQATLWIAGDGPLADDLTDLAEDLGIGRSVRFAGESRNIGNLISASDLVALTSDTEGVPAILHETACLGRPAVATRVGACAEAIQDRETGLLVDRDDEPALVRALGDLVEDREARSRMGAAAAAWFARAGLSMEAVADAYENLYREGLARLARGGRT